MPAYLGNAIVILVLVIACVLAIRSIWNSHKNGGHCDGNCGNCGGCGGCKSTHSSGH